VTFTLEHEPRRGRCPEAEAAAAVQDSEDVPDRSPRFVVVATCRLLRVREVTTAAIDFEQDSANLLAAFRCHYCTRPAWISFAGRSGRRFCICRSCARAVRLST